MSNTEGPVSVIDECWSCGQDLKEGELVAEVLLRKVTKDTKGKWDIEDVNDSNVLHRAHFTCVTEESRSDVIHTFHCGHIAGCNFGNAEAVLGKEVWEQYKERPRA